MDVAAVYRQLTGIEPLNGSNYTTWKTGVDIMLGLSDYEFVLTEEKPPKPTAETSEANKLGYEKWNKANTMAVRLIRASISEAIRGGIPTKDTAKELLELIKAQFVGTKKQLQYYYLTQLITTRYDGLGSVREHIYKMCRLVNGLREQGLAFDDELLVHMVIYSLPKPFENFQLNYNSHEANWSINQLLALCVTEEERLKGTKPELAHLVVAPNKNESKNKNKGFPQGNQPKSVKMKKTSEKGKGKSLGDIECWFCKKTGHLKKDCNGFKDWLKKNQSGHSQPAKT